jgi:hypothetical protein
LLNESRPSSRRIHRTIPNVVSILPAILSNRTQVNRPLAKRFLLCLILPALALLGACAKSVVVETEFPEPVVQSLPLNVGVHYEETFVNYSYTEDLPNDVEWSFDLGGANRKLFDGIFSALFDITTTVDGAGGTDPSYTTLDAVIVPAVEAFEFSLPRQSNTEQYSVWIRYNLQIYTPTGEPIVSWPVSAYGQSDERTFGASAAMEEAVIKAMRDAAASILIGLAEEEKIKEALLSDDNDP